MEQLTFQQEIDRIPDIPEHYIDGEPEAYVNGWKAGMKEGSEWQKEQYKEMITLMRQLLAAYDFRYPDAKQLLAGYSNEAAFNKLNNLINQHCQS